MFPGFTYAKSFIKHTLGAYLSPLKFRLPLVFVPLIFATLSWKISLPLIFATLWKFEFVSISINLFEIEQQITVGNS